MYRIMLAARIGSLCSILIFMILHYSTNKLVIVEHGLMLIFLLCLFVDSLLSYKHPQLVDQAAPNPLTLKLLKAHPLSMPEPSKGYRLGMVIISAILFTACLVRLLGYF